MIEFSKRLIELRTEKGISQKELAKILEVSSSNISYWEQNKGEPIASNIVKLAKFFNVSTDYLLGLED